MGDAVFCSRRLMNTEKEQALRHHFHYYSRSSVISLERRENIFLSPRLAAE